MNRSFVALLLVAPLAVLLAAAPPATSLDIYTIDVEGGKSVLIVSPSGESMLIDVGWPSSANRDASAEVVFDAVKRAGLKRIDYLVLSHFDVDHYSELGTADTNPPSANSSRCPAVMASSAPPNNNARRTPAWPSPASSSSGTK